jgi:hypothetical protein
LVEEAEDLATGVAGAGLLVVHDAEGRRQDNEAELTAGQDVADPLLELLAGAIEARADGAALVEATVEVDDDLARAVVIDDFEFTNVAVLLHDLQELNDNLGAGAEENLTLAATLSARNSAERVGQDAHEGHLDCAHTNGGTRETTQTKSMHVEGQKERNAAPRQRNGSVMQTLFASIVCVCCVVLCGVV